MAKNNQKTAIRLQAMIFDMDGVITNTMPDHYRAWRDILREEGLPVTHLDIYSREGQRGITSVRELFEVHGKRYSPRRGETILRKKETLFQAIVKIRFIPGARRCLKALKRKGVRLALVTGTSRHEMLRILPESLRGLFDVTVTGNDVLNGKPDPEPYLLALKQLGVPASRALVLENAPFGIRSAKAAGIKCFAIATSLPSCYLNQADVVFSSFSDLLSRVDIVPEAKAGGRA
jgi:beta-phosphoglucomutase